MLAGSHVVKLLNITNTSLLVCPGMCLHKVYPVLIYTGYKSKLGKCPEKYTRSALPPSVGGTGRQVSEVGEESGRGNAVNQNRQ